MARVQELFTNKLLSLACGISDIKLVYKVHPNSCTSPSISKRHQSIAELASRHPNIVLLTGNKIDPFILAEHSDLCIGLHSSVLTYAWSLNIPVLAHSRSSSAPFSSYPIDFEFIEINDLTNIVKSLTKNPSSTSILSFNRLLYAIYQCVESQVEVNGPKIVDFFNGNNYDCTQYDNLTKNPYLKDDLEFMRVAHQATDSLSVQLSL